MKIPVFYACDDNFVKYMIVSMHSLIKNCDRDRQYRIYVMNTGLSEEMKAIVLGMACENVEIEFVDVTEHLQTLGENIPVRDYYSKTTYFRIFIPNMFPEYDKALYIDCDTLVQGDIGDLYETDIADNYVGAVVDQVISTSDVFGPYVEQVIGVDRHKNFNAGMLLINCRQFREQRLLEKFIGMLRQYNFVITQDEDYLNVLCKEHIHWLDKIWNFQVFNDNQGEIEKVKILHFVMFSKPWHYEECPYAERFWNYAKETKVYDRLKAELSAYSEEQKAEDARSAERLLQTARDEIARDDNYLKMLQRGELKAVDRLLVLDKIAELEKEGRFDVDVEEDPPTKVLYPEDIDYLRKKHLSRLKTRLAYRSARIFLNNIIDQKKLVIKDIKGIEHFQNLQSGAVITCNHFSAMDSFIIQVVYEAARQRKRKFFRVIREGNYTNFPGFYGMLMRNCNTLPLSSNMETMKKFMKSVDTLLNSGHFVLVYPEQSMWWNYRKPKPLKKGAFTFAARNNVPVLPCFITMEDSDRIGEDGFYIQDYTAHVGAPIYPDPEKSRAENVEAMRQANYDIWKKIYEETYKEPLTYSCDVGKNA